MNPDVRTGKEHLIEGLAVLGPTAPVWRGLHWLLETNIATEQVAVCREGVSSEEVHRARGRLGMLLEFKGQLDEAMSQALKD
jgi:hypothetical protein